MKKFKTAEEQAAFYSGARYMRAYIKFCITNYAYQLNIAGLAHFFNDMCNFVNGMEFIPNKHNNLSFRRFCEEFSINE